MSDCNFYVYLNPGLTIDFNGEKYHSENGLKDLLEENIPNEDMLYPIIHLKGEDIIFEHLYHILIAKLKFFENVFVRNEANPCPFSF